MTRGTEPTARRLLASAIEALDRAKSLLNMGGSRPDLIEIRREIDTAMVAVHGVRRLVEG